MGSFAASVVAGSSPAAYLRLAAGCLALSLLAIRAWRWWRARARRWELDRLLRLDPADFELAVAQLLSDVGFSRVRVSGGTGDLSVDVVCADPRGRSVVVQCKRYSPGKRVGSPAVQQLIGMAFSHHQADRSILVTTSTFTGPAVALARQHGIELLDGPALAAMSRRSSLVAGSMRHEVL